MTAPSGAAAAPVGPSRSRLLRHAGGILVALIVEAILGAGLTATVVLPSSPTVGQVFASIPLLTAHIVLAFALVAGTLYFLVVAVRSRVDGLAWRGAVSAGFVLVALANGFAFTFTGNNAYSMGMLGAFLLALIGQVLVLLRIRQIPAAPVPGTTQV